MPSSYRYTGTYNEFDNRGTTLSDHTLDPTNQSNTGGGFWGPTAVLALVTPNSGTIPPGTVLILGDSIIAGTGDVPDSVYLQGYGQRSLENNIPFITLARGSTTLQEEVNAGTGQFSFINDDTIYSDVLIGLGRNDLISFSQSPAAVLANLTTLTARYSNAGLRTWCVTVPPTTISNDGWTTTANQAWLQTNYTTTGTVASGAGSIVLSSSSNVASGELVTVPTITSSLSSTLSNGSSLMVMTSVSALSAGEFVYGPGSSSGMTISSISGSTLTLSGTVTLPATLPSGVTYNFGTAIYPGTTITATSGATITLSHVTIGTISSGGTIDLGVFAPTSQVSGLESNRESYNTSLRGTGYLSYGCNELIDVDASMADPGGSYKWRTDLGAASVDGIHPNSVLHSKVISDGRFATSYISR
ncbi:unnamed protein product [Sphagnum jensenii]